MIWSTWCSSPTLTGSSIRALINGEASSARGLRGMIEGCKGGIRVRISSNGSPFEMGSVLTMESLLAISASSSSGTGTRSVSATTSAKELHGGGPGGLFRGTLFGSRGADLELSLSPSSEEDFCGGLVTGVGFLLTTDFCLALSAGIVLVGMFDCFGIPFEALVDFDGAEAFTEASAFGGGAAFPFGGTDGFLVKRPNISKCYANKTR
jgi:hypothetical protein